MTDKYPNSGILFKNNHKEKDTQPDYRGDGMIICPQCGDKIKIWASLWKKEGSKGTYLTISFKPKDENKQIEGQSSQQETKESVLDIPF